MGVYLPTRRDKDKGTNTVFHPLFFLTHLLAAFHSATITANNNDHPPSLVPIFTLTLHKPRENQTNRRYPNSQNSLQYRRPQTLFPRVGNMQHPRFHRKCRPMGRLRMDDESLEGTVFKGPCIKKGGAFCVKWAGMEHCCRRKSMVVVHQEQ